MAGRWSTSTFRQWLGLDVAYSTSSIWASSISVLRWPSQLTTTTNPSRWWVPPRLMRWPELDFSILDDVVWSLVTAFDLEEVSTMFLVVCCRRMTSSGEEFGGRVNNSVVVGLAKHGGGHVSGLRMMLLKNEELNFLALGNCSTVLDPSNHVSRKTPTTSTWKLTYLTGCLCPCQLASTPMPTNPCLLAKSPAGGYYWPWLFTSLHDKAHGWNKGCCDVVLVVGYMLPPWSYMEKEQLDVLLAFGSLSWLGWQTSVTRLKIVIPITQTAPFLEAVHRPLRLFPQEPFSGSNGFEAVSNEIEEATEKGHEQQRKKATSQPALPHKESKTRKVEEGTEERRQCRPTSASPSLSSPPADQNTYNSQLKKRYKDDPSTHPNLDLDLWL
ncbi:hypothetical protein NC653_012643 [Populus alba x Populus x berolinensis]|uniref:Uncharacterized protein n=1 Tax=Populus alba x Populus x berolinensis TaxID=444605 RepID=A0AAD6W1M2_9ROSI|nr:hypothetical protein NC653_012643 [Populus alba x Populus x berolinensis]